MPSIKVSDINIYFEIYGQGKPLLMIAGLGSELSSWLFQIPEFSKKYSVIVFDNRGVGRSDIPDRPYSIRMMADDAASLLDKLGINEAHILGVSMGSFIAQEFAITYPEKVRSLILVASRGRPYPLGRHVVETRAKMALEGASRELIIRDSLPWLFTDEFFENPQFVQLVIDTMLKNPSPQPAYAYARQIAACAEHNTLERLCILQTPTLILSGAEDILAPPKMSMELAASIAGAKFKILKGGAHALIVEIADKFNREVLEFLERIDSC